MDRPGPTAESPKRQDELVGATLGNYHVRGLIGQGGMGSVFLAEHVLIGRRVALKVLDPRIADNAEAVSRFFVEARAANDIQHPNIVDVTDLGTHEGRPFIVMEYLDGETLEARLALKGRLAPAEAVVIARQIASALGAAHERGLVHRDLKPANVVICSHDDYPHFVKVLDFGIAKLLGGSRVAGAHNTENGTALGTPAYMSPEQCLGEEGLDHRSDVYSLGVILYQMLSGQVPFDFEAPARVIFCHVQQPVPPLLALDAEIPEPLVQVVERALEKRPALRFPSMREMKRALDTALTKRRNATPTLVMPAVPEEKPAPAVLEADRPTAVLPVARPPKDQQVPAGPRQPAGETPSVPGRSSLAGLGFVEAVRVRLSEETGILPALAPALRLSLEALADPDASGARLGRALRGDNELVRHVLRRANSDGPPGRGVVVAPDRVLERLGAKGTRNAILEVALRRLFDASSPRIVEEFPRQWTHALAGAIVAARLSTLHWSPSSPEDAYLAGLLRDAGIPLLAAVLFKTERELSGQTGRRFAPATWLELLESTQRELGAQLARSWGVTDDIVEAVMTSSLPADGGPGALPNLVWTAAALADEAGFVLRPETALRAAARLQRAKKALDISDPILRAAVDRLKVAVAKRA